MGTLTLQAKLGDARYDELAKRFNHQEAPKNAVSLVPDLSGGATPAYETLRLGSIIPCRMGEVIKGDYNKSPDVFVTALWRDDTKRIRKIEAMYISSSPVAKRYLHDLSLNTSQARKDFHRDKDAYIPAGRTYLIDNTKQFFPDSQYRRSVPQGYLIDLLVRRAAALLYSPSVPCICTSQVPESLTREGFTFREIQPDNVRAMVFGDSKWIPDISFTDIRRQSSALVTQSLVDQTARFAAFHYNTYAVPHYKQPGQKEAYEFPRFDMKQIKARADTAGLFTVWEKGLQPERGLRQG